MRLLTHWALENVADKLTNIRNSSFSTRDEKLAGECRRNSQIRNQHWFRRWLGAVRQQAIISSSAD